MNGDRLTLGEKFFLMLVIIFLSILCGIFFDIIFGTFEYEFYKCLFVDCR